MNVNSFHRIDRCFENIAGNKTGKPIVAQDTGVFNLFYDFKFEFLSPH